MSKEHEQFLKDFEKARKPTGHGEDCSCWPCFQLKAWMERERELAHERTREYVRATAADRKEANRPRNCGCFVCQDPAQKAAEQERHESCSGCAVCRRQLKRLTERVKELDLLVTELVALVGKKESL